MILLVVLGTLVKLTSTFQTLRTIFILPPVAVSVSKVERPSHFIAVLHTLHTLLERCIRCWDAAFHRSISKAFTYKTLHTLLGRCVGANNASLKNRKPGGGGEEEPAEGAGDGEGDQPKKVPWKKKA